MSDAVGELESLGYTAAWLPDVGGDDVLDAIDNLLTCSTSLTAATGILDLWLHEPPRVATRFAQLDADHGRRFLMVIGVSHGPFINSIEAGRYTKPLSRMAEFLDGLDAADPPMPAGVRVPPRSARRCWSSPAPTPPAPTRTSSPRSTPQWPGRPSAGDPIRRSRRSCWRPTRTRRAAGRAHLAVYLGLPNYVNNWKRFGFTDDDVADGGSDRLVDALVAWGDEDAVRQRVQAHRGAGAAHVCIQVVGIEWNDLPLDEWRRLAPALIG